MGDYTSPKHLLLPPEVFASLAVPDESPELGTLAALPHHIDSSGACYPMDFDGPDCD